MLARHEDAFAAPVQKHGLCVIPALASRAGHVGAATAADRLGMVGQTVAMLVGRSARVNPVVNMMSFW